MILKVILCLLFMPFHFSLLYPPPLKLQFALLGLIFPFAFNVVCQGTYLPLLSVTFDTIFLTIWSSRSSSDLPRAQGAPAPLRNPHLASTFFQIRSWNSAVPDFAFMVQQDMCASLLQDCVNSTYIDNVLFPPHFHRC